MKDINRLKDVLVERKKTGKWLAEQFVKDPSLVSKWCSNTSQPSLEALDKNCGGVAKVQLRSAKIILEIDIINEINSILRKLLYT